MPAPGGILALDLSLSVGWCYGHPGETPLYGTWALPVAASAGQRMASFENELLDAIAVHDPSLVVLEAAITNHKNAASARIAIGLWALSEAACWRHDVRCIQIGSGQARAAVTGRGTYPKGTAKDNVLAWCRENEFQPANDHEADALITFLAACKQRRKSA
jgi:Holliday junction resolvasome RuvABC endonuclease subunit